MLAFFWPKLRGGFGSKINAGNLNDLRAKVVPGDGSVTPFFFAEAQAWLVPMQASEMEGSSFEGLPVVVGAEGGEPGLMALWQKCVHLGCRVPDCSSSAGFECPCHGSKYNYHGEYDSGPAPRNLDRFALEVDDRGALIDGPTVLEPDRQGPTAALKSAAKMDHIRTGGTLLNQKFAPRLLEGEKGIDSLAHLVRTYFKLGGHHIQFNVVDAATLRDAQAHPENHRDLIVRVAGYSDYFCDLGRALQDEIIARTEHQAV